MGGKTGSAQVVTHARLESNKNARDYQPHGWFIAFAPPTEARRSRVAVLVEHGAAGGESAAPVVGQALARYFGVRAIGPGMRRRPTSSPPTRSRCARRPPPAPRRVGERRSMPVDRRLLFNIDWVLLARRPAPRRHRRGHHPLRAPTPAAAPGST